MPRWVPLAVVAVSLTVGLHFYLWARLVRDPAWASPFRELATLALIVLGAALPLSFALTRAFGSRAMRFLLWPAFVWMGFLLLLFFLTLLGDLVRLALSLAGDERLRDPERRRALARLLAGVTAGASGALGALAIRNGARSPALTELEIRLDRLPPGLDGTVIVQLTDVHVGPTLGRRFIEELVARTNALHPDLIAITGDLVDGAVADLRDHVAPLAQLKARHGVFFVTGNHEYYSGVDAWLVELGRLGVRVLRNERVAIGGAGGFDLAGIDDYNASGFGGGHGPDLERALAGRDPARELVLLAHQPRAVHEAARADVGLQLSGHTHGGQLWPWNWLVRLQQPYVVGLAREGRTQIYTSPGTGYWGPPMRLGTRSEITKITLRAVS